MLTDGNDNVRIKFLKASSSKRMWQNSRFIHYISILFIVRFSLNSEIKIQRLLTSITLSLAFKHH